MFARALWGDERKFTTMWDAEYPGTLGSAYGPCVGSSNAHCGATFIPNLEDQAPYLPDGHPGCSVVAGSEGVFSGPNSNIPWAIKWSRGLCNLTCSQRFIPGAKPSASCVYFLYRLSINVGDLPNCLSLYVGNKGLWTGLTRVVRSKTPDGATDIDLDSENFGNSFVCKGKEVSRTRSFLDDETLAALFNLLNLVSTTSIELWTKGSEWNVEKRMPVYGTSQAALMEEEDLIELVDGCKSLFSAYQRACQ